MKVLRMGADQQDALEHEGRGGRNRAMRHRASRLRLIVAYIGAVLLTCGVLFAIPISVSFILGSAGRQDVRAGTFAIPMSLSILVGLLCRHCGCRRERGGVLRRRDALLICVFGWLAVSAVGAIPFTYHLRLSYLDGFFEAMSGFTTTGITMLSGLDSMPRSLLLWRAMTQWVGGLGILAFFTVLVFEGGISHKLFGAESHKVGGGRPAPGMWNSLRIFWAIYLLLTAATVLTLALCGMSVYDSVCHALTAVSTGGFSTHDASIAFYEQAGYRYHAAIEYVLTAAMLAGGTSFLIHYRLLRGDVRSLWDNDEARAWWGIVVVGVVAVAVSRWVSTAGASAHETFRHSLFQVVAIGTTTGFATRDIGSEYFTALAQQLFLALMVTGACAGSTSGGFKVIRATILWKMVRREVRKMVWPDRTVQPLLLDGRKVESEELARVSGLFFAWIVLLLLGAAVTAAFSELGPLQSASGMFSALGNIGPCYIPVTEMAELHPVIKVFYILAMLAGRLEIVPVLMLLSPRSWK